MFGWPTQCSVHPSIVCRIAGARSRAGRTRPTCARCHAPRPRPRSLAAPACAAGSAPPASGLLYYCKRFNSGTWLLYSCIYRQVLHFCMWEFVST
jgi:hypothetical protein